MKHLLTAFLSLSFVLCAMALHGSARAASGWLLVANKGEQTMGIIDPAASNEPAIRCYAKVGFRPVGVMRQYERGPDGTFHDGLLMDLLRDELPPSPRKRRRG